MGFNENGSRSNKNPHNSWDWYEANCNIVHTHKYSYYSWDCLRNIPNTQLMISTRF
jgi:hypothetical protein